MGKIYFYKNLEHSVAYDQKGWYIDDILQENSESERENIDIFKQKAISQAYNSIAYDIRKYSACFKNIAILTGAGTSMENEGLGGKTRKELWDSYKNEIIDIKKCLGKSSNSELKKKCEEVCNSENIENFLSFVLLYEKLTGKIQDTNGEFLTDKLEKEIADACRLRLAPDNMHHQDFLRKLSARKPGDPRVQLYTTNYDTLFEQAANRMNFTILDGFSFSYPRIFNGKNFDYDIVYRDHTRVKQEESFVPNAIQLFKLHGSINWEKESNGNIYQREKVEKPCIIYPASQKYESSYEQPYFEMIAHLQQTLRKDGTLMIVVGFGFQDKHIQNIIKEAVLQNLNFHLIIVCYGQMEIIKEDCSKGWEDSGITHNLVPDYINEELDVKPNVTILFSKFKSFVENYPINDSYSNETL